MKIADIYSIQHSANLQTDPLQALLIHLRKLEGIRQQVHAKLTADLLKHCYVANWRNGCLVFAVDSSAWATRLRFLQPDLIEKLRSDATLPGLRTIDYFIKPITTETVIKHPSRKLVLSRANAKLLQQTADSMPKNELSDALRRLAGTRKATLN